MSGAGWMTYKSAMVMESVINEIFIKKDVEQLRTIPFIVIGIFFLLALFTYGENYIMAYIGQRVVAKLRDRLYSRIQLQPLSFFGKNPTGTLMARITYDINLVSESVSNGLGTLLRESIKMLWLIWALFVKDVQLAIIALVLYPLAMYPVIRMGKRMRKVGTFSQQEMGNMNTFLHETIS